MMNREEVIWLAGLLEGEGCFSIARQHGNLKVGIVIGMTDYDVILRVSQLFNKNRISSKTLKSGKVYYTAQIWGIDAIDIMKLLQPHMFGRRSAKIQEILEKWSWYKLGVRPYRQGAGDLKLLLGQ